MMTLLFAAAISSQDSFVHLSKSQINLYSTAFSIDRPPVLDEEKCEKESWMEKKNWRKPQAFM